MAVARQHRTHTLRLGLSQHNATVGDLSANLQLVLDAMAQARQAHCDMIAFPELVLTGYPPEDLLLQHQFVREAQQAIQTIARQTRGLVAIIGCLDRNRQRQLHNAAAVCAQGRLLGAYHKMCLPNYGVFDERRYFVPGQRPVVLRWRGVTIGVSICEDMWQADGPLPAEARAGARLLINISASPYHAGKYNERQRVARHWARWAQATIAYVNLVGGQDELVFDGGSFVMDPRGRVIAQAPSFHEGLLIVDVPLQATRTSTRRAPVRTIRLPLWPSPPARPPVTPQRAAPLAPLEEIYQALVLGTRDYVRKNDFASVVLGLSGGIDSALTAVIAVDAIGREQVVALAMPSQYSSAETQADAARLAEQLGIGLWRLPIDAILQAYLSTLASAMPHQRADVTEQNLQARIRGSLLMACSNKFGWLVLSTGNKSEMATGYCTLYGDMAGGFAVLKDVPKTLVYALARLRSDRAAVPLIPERIWTRPPTAELAPHQTDQDTLPPYDMLDPILKAYIEDDWSQRMIAQRHGHAETVQRVMRMVDRTEYKRRQGAPGIKITPRAFGKDRRMPITNRYQEGRVRSAVGGRRSAVDDREPRTTRTHACKKGR